MFTLKHKISAHLPSTIRHLPSAICHLPSAIRHLPSAIRHLPPAIRHPPPAIRHPPSAIRPLPSAIRHPPSAPCHPLSAIRYLLLGLALVACGFLGPAPAEKEIVIPNRLPTLTPTAQVGVGQAAPAPAPVEPVVPPAAPGDPGTGPAESVNPGESVPPADPAAPPPVDPAPVSPPFAIPDVGGWSFREVQAQASPDVGGLQLYGNLVNNTGATQEILLITGAALDAQGQTIASEESIYGFWPVAIVPPGSHAPFSLAVEGLESLATLNLNIEAQPNEDTPRQDFELADLYERNETDTYCVGGVFRNTGSPLQDYLLIVATLYNSQEQVIGFSDYYLDPEDIGDETAEPFEICLEAAGQPVGRYEVQAWGQ